MWEMEGMWKCDKCGSVEMEWMWKYDKYGNVGNVEVWKWGWLKAVWRK
jgi:hypothetical protein